MICAGISLPSKTTREKSCTSFQALLSKSGPCLLFIALLFILVALILLLTQPSELNSIGFDDDTIIVYSGTPLWPTKWYGQALGSYPSTFHLVDLYKVQTSDLKEYRRLETYHIGETFFPNLTYSAGKIDGIYLVHGTTLDYDIVAHSQNLTTESGQLAVFTSLLDYYFFVRGRHLDNPPFYSAFNFSIGADSRPIKTSHVIRANYTSYYYFACKVPGNSTFSFTATSNVVFYNRSDFGDKLVTLASSDNTIFYLPAMNESVTLLGYIRPNSDGSYSSINMHFYFTRLLPSPSLTVTVFGMTLILCVLIVYHVMLRHEK